MYKQKHKKDTYKGYTKYTEIHIEEHTQVISTHISKRGEIDISFIQIVTDKEGNQPIYLAVSLIVSFEQQIFVQFVWHIFDNKC